MESNFLGWSSAMAPAIMGNAERPELGEELTASFCRTDPEIAARFARVTFMSDNRADLATVTVPTLVLQCSDDVIAPDGGRRVRARADSRLGARADGGHRPLPEPQRARGDHRRDPSVRLTGAGMGVSDLSAEDLYENAPCGYLSASPDGTIVRVNATFLRWTGYAREDLVGAKRFQDLLSPGGRIYHETHYAPLLRMQGTVREIAVDIVTADRSRLPVLVNSVLVTDDAGEPQLVRTTLFDARERKAYERELLAARDRERRARETVERLHDAERAISHTLQQSLLAGAPPLDPRFQIATLYQPALEQLEVGGDWHDAFTLPDGRVAVAVGDVVGRGLTAATAMGQLRSAVRALAVTGAGPRAVMQYLDTFVAQIEEAQLATLVYAEIDPDSGITRLAAAGHLPPVIVSADGHTRLFMEGRSTPLGVRTDAVPRVEATLRLEPGERMVLYTDGLVERRNESIDAGLERLLAAVVEDARPESLARALEEDGRGDDDVCVLVFTRTPR